MELIERGGVIERGSIPLTAEMVYGFVAGVLLSSFDNPQPIPSCHMEWWELICSKHKKVAIAAPRGHAKTTAITHSFVLAAMLFRFRDHCMIVSDTEDQACAFLSDIKMELEENQNLKALFGVERFVKDKETEVIVRLEDGHKFRIIARGSNQKLRGLKWRHKRPNLVIGDDLENDEMVMNQDRRTKFREWFYGALLPAGSDDCIFRIVGTILHLDAMLERLMPPLGSKLTKQEGLRSVSTNTEKVWKSFRYKAHNEDFSEILWPEKFSQKRLEDERRDYVEQGYPEGYAQEYLNYPIDDSTAYFKRDDFRHTFDIDELSIPLNYYSAVDFAISQRERADYTAIATVGVDSKNNIYVVDVRRGRWDAKEIIDEMIQVHHIYEPDLFTVEKGSIERALGPFLRDKMQETNTYLNLNLLNPGQDKQARARSIQARLRQGAVYFDPRMDWYDSFADEMRTFPRGAHDDMVDAFSWIGLTLDKQTESPTQMEWENEQWEESMGDFSFNAGRCVATGY